MQQILDPHKMMQCMQSINLSSTNFDAIVDQMKLLDDERDKSDDKNPQINKAIASVINK